MCPAAALGEPGRPAALWDGRGMVAVMKGEEGPSPPASGDTLPAAGMLRLMGSPYLHVGGGMVGSALQLERLLSRSKTNLGTCDDCKQ